MTTETKRLRAWRMTGPDGVTQSFDCPKCNSRNPVLSMTVSWQRERSGGLWRLLGLERAERLCWRCICCNARVYSVTHEGRGHS